ncbi:LysR family transcriptional regulator [Streptomyces thinghirensis]|nr:LysR family transcriptional regulator [Streptomyces thinghirensis]
MHRSQPRVSVHVAALERAAGVPLFDRDQRPVALTDAGAVLAEHAHDAAPAVRRGGPDGRAPGAARGIVTLGSFPSASAAFVPQLLERMARTRPAIKVVLVERPTLELDGALAGARWTSPCAPHVSAAGPVRGVTPAVVGRAPSSSTGPTIRWRAAGAVCPVGRVAQYPLIRDRQAGISQAMGFRRTGRSGNAASSPTPSRPPTSPRHSSAWSAAAGHRGPQCAGGHLGGRHRGRGADDGRAVRPAGRRPLERDQPPDTPPRGPC